jgi:hypothetical protein
MRVASCWKCRYSGYDLEMDREPPEYWDTECRRHAPVADKVDSSRDLRQWVPRFPIMKVSDWCGEWVHK